MAYMASAGGLLDSDRRNLSFLGNDVFSSRNLRIGGDGKAMMVEPWIAQGGNERVVGGISLSALEQPP